MSEVLTLASLPALPQVSFLHELAPALWQRPDVEALWLEGSLGRGNADLYSDIDLYVCVPPAAHDAWRTIDIAALFGDVYAAHHVSDFAADFFVYHVYLNSGVIYDLHIQPRSRELPAAERMILACRDEKYRAELLAAAPTSAEEANTIFAPKALDPSTLQPQLINFWINADKGRKVLYRRQDLTCYTGLHLFRQMLVRLLFIEQTGTDCGDLTRPTIHGLKAAAAVLGAALGDELYQLMGPPMRNRQEIWAAQDRLHREFARVGRVLADRHDIAYPAALEAVVMANWAEFEQEIGKG
ncbi:MAG: nucleotidyltransferase domain-containing protein [Caldilineaceae bacterium]